MAAGRRCSSEARLDLLEPANGDGVIAVPQLRFEAGALHFELRADDTRTRAPQDRQQWLLQHTGTAPEEDVRASRMEPSEHKEKLAALHRGVSRLSVRWLEVYGAVVVDRR